MTNAKGVKLFSAGNDCLMYDHDGKRIDPLVDKTIERVIISSYSVDDEPLSDV